MLIVVVLALLLFPSVGFSNPADYPEANPNVAFRAGDDQRIWNKQGNLVTMAMSWPVSRFTLTVYDDEFGRGDGVATLTHRDPKGDRTVTFYYNVRLLDEPRAKIGFEFYPGMWEEGFLNLIPQQEQVVVDRFSEMPFDVRTLSILPPIGGYITEKEGVKRLELVLGGPALSGIIVLPLQGFTSFSDEQNERQVKIWAAGVLSPISVRWERGGKQYEWAPGMQEPKSTPRKIPVHLRM